MIDATLRDELEWITPLEAMNLLEGVRGSVLKSSSEAGLYSELELRDAARTAVDKGDYESAKGMLDALNAENPRDPVFLKDPLGSIKPLSAPGVAWALGVTEEMLEYPLPQAVLPGHSLMMPDGYEWTYQAPTLGHGFYAAYALKGPGGAEVACFEAAGNGIWATVDGACDNRHVDPQSLYEAMLWCECEAIDAQHLIPVDREGYGEHVNRLMRHCAKKASERIFEEVRGSLGAARDWPDVPVCALTAAEYAWQYPDGVLIPEQLADTFMSHGGVVSMTDLIEECARCHAAADIDWSDEHFQERGCTEIEDVAASLSERQEGLTGQRAQAMTPRSERAARAEHERGGLER